MTAPARLVILAGGTGDLGRRIADALAVQGVPTRALVRSGAKRELLPSGTETAEVDFTDARALGAACQGGTCVVSAVNGLHRVVVYLQSRLLDAAVAAGVPRFIPSDFSLDFTRTQPGRNRNLDLRREFKARVDAAPIAATSILNGAFADLLAGQAPIVLKPIRRVLYWGDPDQPFDFTTKDDIATFTAAVAVDPNTPRILRIAGDTVSPRNLATIMTELTGTRFRLLRAGGLGRLGTLIRVARLVAPQPKAVFPAWQGMQYLRDMASGEGRLSPLDNDRYPGLAWTGARAVLQAAFVRDRGTDQEKPA